MDVISWDLDSTLVDTRHRQHMVLEGDQRHLTDWSAYSQACTMDTEGPAWGMFLAMQDPARNLRHVAVSRRDYSAWDQTNFWFDERGLGFDEIMLLKGPHSTSELDHGGWKIAQIKAYEARTANRVVLHVDDAPIGDKFEAAKIPFLQIVSASSEFITKPKGLVAG